MCASIIDGEQEIETIGQLRDWLNNLPGINVVKYESWIKDKSDLHVDDCLCNVNLPATLNANGIPYKWDGVWFVTKREEANRE